MFLVIAFHPAGSLFHAAFGPGIDEIERLRHRLYALDQQAGVTVNRTRRRRIVRKPANDRKKDQLCFL